MRVAAIYDIHGNLPALEAVIRAIEDEGVDLVVVGGDVVPGPMPDACVAALRALVMPTRFIHGNGEADVLTVCDGQTPDRVPEAFRDIVAWTAGQLSPETVAEIRGWPLTIELAVPVVGDTLFCHATPRHDNELFTRLTPESALLPIFEEAGADLVICGHTHMQFDRRVGRVRVVNAGSVGMPFGEPGAAWVLVGPEGVELRRSTYDLEAAAARIEGSAYPSTFDVLDPPSEASMLAAFEAAALR